MLPIGILYCNINNPGVWWNSLTWGCNLKQFDGLAWLTLTIQISRQIYCATANAVNAVLRFYSGNGADDSSCVEFIVVHRQRRPDGVYRQHDSGERGARRGRHDHGHADRRTYHMSAARDALQTVPKVRRRAVRLPWIVLLLLLFPCIIRDFCRCGVLLQSTGALTSIQGRAGLSPNMERRGH